MSRPRIPTKKLEAAAAELVQQRGSYFNAKRLVWVSKQQTWGSGRYHHAESLDQVARRHGVSPATLRRHLRAAADSIKTDGDQGSDRHGSSSVSQNPRSD